MLVRVLPAVVTPEPQPLLRANVPETIKVLTDDAEVDGVAVCACHTGGVGVLGADGVLAGTAAMLADALLDGVPEEEQMMDGVSIVEGVGSCMPV